MAKVGALNNATGRQGVKNPELIRERTDALARASASVFGKKGFHASRISDIVRSAGISQGSVYNYVNSKEDLLYLVCQEYLSAYRRRVNKALLGTKSPSERLKAVLMATIEVMREYRRHHLVLQREMHNLDPRARTRFLRDAAEFRGICEEVLVNATKDEGYEILHPRLVANILIHLPSLIVMRHWDLDEGISDEEVDAEIVDFLLKGLGLKSPENDSCGQ
jgi:AcrR family transcriptional regulator